MNRSKRLVSVIPFILSLIFVNSIARGTEPIRGADEVKDFLETYRAGAADGVAEDQYNLGASYRWGVGIPRNASLAAQWIRKAADQGYPLAERILGEMYEKGEGLPVSNVDALLWYKRAALTGDPLAQQAFNALKVKIQP